MFNKNEVRRYKPIEYDDMPGDMVTAEDFDRMYESITNHTPDPPPTAIPTSQPIREEQLSDEQAVKQVYRDMVVTRYPLTKVNGCIVWECAYPFSKVLGRGNTKEEALLDARSKLPKPEPNPQPASAK